MLAGAGIVFAVLLGIIFIVMLTQKPEKMEISNMDISSVSDGTYVGRADNGFVKAAVSVEVSDGKLKSITILEHDTLLGRPGEKIIDDIVEQQSLEVDAVSSATYSSDTIRKAVENALKKGE
nr:MULTISPECIES: FMN-binding protein [Blautia]